MKTLFDSTSINHILLKNRFVRSATWEALADDHGHLTESLLTLYADLAKGDVGLIITGCVYVSPDGKGLPGMLGIYDDLAKESCRKLVNGVHQYGGKLVAQLSYSGTQSIIQSVAPVFSPSAVPEKSTGIVGKEMSEQDIALLKGSFVQAALRAKAAGFDGIQIHASHGFLLSQFLTPFHNRRSDQYGGSIENRARLLIEIYEAVRSAVGDEFAVLAKINCADFIEQGLSLEESLYVCEQLAQKGIDALEISGGLALHEQGATRQMILSAEQEAYFADYASMIAEKTNIPVILVGGLRSQEVMECLLHDGKISYFSMSRPFIAEPDLISRWKNGDTQKAKCVSCNQCLMSDGAKYCAVF